MEQTMRSRPWWLSVLALVAIAFGLLTLKAGGSVIFFDGEARRAAGHYVHFVVWFNFLAGFGYVLAGVGLWGLRSWAVWLAAAIAAGTLLTFAAFGVHVYTGGLYEMRTVIAMTLRSGVWLAIALLALRTLRPRQSV
jgi:hypothetical protein